MSSGESDGHGGFRAVVFDVDQTLAPFNSWLAVTTGLGAPMATHGQLWREFQRGLLGNQQARQRIRELWRATGKATRDEIEHVFRHLPIRPTAPSVISQIRRRGRLVCLISSAIDMYVQMVAEQLGVPYWYANGHLSFGSDGYLRDVEFDLAVEERKRNQLVQFSASHGLRAHEILVVGDGATDALMFEYTQRGLLLMGGPVPGDPSRAWRVIHDLTEVLDHLPDHEGGLDEYGASRRPAS